MRLIKMGVDDFTVLIRSSDDGRFHHRYVGPDLIKAEEIFTSESDKLLFNVD
ncbi:MAG: hypothetical protein WC647_01065 [Desulfomonilaceae bacterium]